MGLQWHFSFLVEYNICGTLFKNCGNLSLNSAGVYLYNSELTLSYPFFINLKAFSDSSDVIKVSV